MANYKPDGYNSLSPYLIVDGAQQLVDQLCRIFGAEILRRFDREDGRISHVELKLEDTVVMISDSTGDYAAQKAMLHCYVSDVFATFEKALANGGVRVEDPASRPGDPDTRGAFLDCAGNYWAVSTQGTGS